MNVILNHGTMWLTGPGKQYVTAIWGVLSRKINQFNTKIRYIPIASRKILVL